MKKLTLIMIAVFLNGMLISCTDNDEILTQDDTKLTKEVKASTTELQEDCCSGDGTILPPPPPDKPTKD